MIYQIICVFVFLLFYTLSLASVSHEKDFPFISGEKLEYDLSWGFIPVGKATLEIWGGNPKLAEHWKILFFVRTNDFADAFYKVRTRVWSEVDHNFTKSLSYKKDQQEGKTQKMIDVSFDYQKKQSYYSENDSKPIVLNLEERVFDPMAITYAFRMNQMVSGEKRTIPTSDGKKLLQVEINVGKNESVRVPFGKFGAHAAIPKLKNLSGVFKKSPKGILKVWYSSDARRLPLKISSKVVVGSFTAKLRKATKLKNINN